MSTINQLYIYIYNSERPLTIMITIITVYSHHSLHEIKLNFTLNWMDAWAPHANYVRNYRMKILLMIIFAYQNKTKPSPGVLEPPFFGQQPNTLNDCATETSR